MDQAQGELFNEMSVRRARGLADRIERNLAGAESGQEATGEELKEEATKRVWERSSEVWRKQALRLVQCLAASGGEITIDDVREAARCSGLYEPHHHNAWGALMHQAARKGFIVRTDIFRKSTRPEAKARMIRVWRSRLREEEELQGG